MKIYKSVLNIDGSHLKGVNPLPMFRDREKDKTVLSDGTLTKEEQKKIGYEIGFRVLPYNIQDSYDRDKKIIELKTVVIENEKLRATFLCEYGARLYSLTDLKTGRDLLFTNEVFQLANLANRNAWFSGGIEWNVGHYGHMFQTCEPLFFSVVKDANGNYFLRIYEFERTKRIYYQIDFHLPDGSKNLYAYVRIINDDDFSKAIYWWTNIAVKEDKSTRVFSDTSHVIFIHPDSIGAQGEVVKKFGACNLPNVETIKGKDATFPLNSPYSNEYFFQVSKNCKSPFEAALYDDGFVFFERSTMPLQFRKMFCWGNLKGGRKWQDFLSVEGKGDYIEIQAGLAPTQVHGLDMEANSIIEFLQVFSFDNIDGETKDICYDECYEKARAKISEVVENNISTESVLDSFEHYKKLADLEIKEILHCGRGYGAIEERRRELYEKRTTPTGFLFPKDSIKDDERVWYKLLENGYLEDDNNIKSFMTDVYFKYILEDAIKKNKTATMLTHLGIMYYEEFREQDALAMWTESIKINPTPLAYRNIAYYYREKKDFLNALKYMEKCFEVDKELDKAYYEEYFDLLIKNKEYKKLTYIYNAMNDNYKNEERIKIYLANAYLYLEEYEKLEEIFKMRQVLHREGENLLLDIYFIYKAKILAKKNGLEYNGDYLSEVRNTIEIPDHLEFRMVIK